MIEEEIAGWADAIEDAVVGTRFAPRLVRVFESCGSTQDPARDLGPGAVVTAGVQTDGRGRLGRRWIDTEGSGIALSVGLEPSDPAVLSVAAGLAVLQTLRRFTTPSVEARIGLKFPNDVVDRVSARKFAGMLIESDASVAVLGIGVNVRIPAAPIDAPAMSVEEVAMGDRRPDRLPILIDLLQRLDHVLELDVDVLRQRYELDHAPTGGTVLLEADGVRFEGRLESLDPFGAVLLREVGTGRIREFGASQVRLVSWKPLRSGS